MIREMEERDIPTLVAFYNELDRLEPMEMSTTVEEWTRVWHNPDRATATRLLALRYNEDGSEEKMVGYGLAYGGEAAWLRLHVLPAYRNQGVASTLYERLSRFVVDAKVWRTSPDQRATLAVEFYQKHGFQFDRYGWEMRLAAEVALAKPRIPAGYTIRTFVSGQDVETYWRTVNAAFAQHHWHEDVLLAEIVYLSEGPTFNPQGVFFASHAEEVVGVCYTVINPAEIERRGMRVGWIEDLGVVPAHQSKGLGRALLLTGVCYLRQSVDVVELGVEGKNAQAMPLYESVGFRPYKGDIMMFKPTADAAAH